MASTPPRELTRSRPHINVLILTMFDDDASVFQAMRAGARGYLLKGAGEQEIERAVRDVAGGEAIFGPAVAQRVLDYLTGTAPRQQQTVFPELSEREQDVLTLLAEGRSNPDIARRLYLGPDPRSYRGRGTAPVARLGHTPVHVAVGGIAIRAEPFRPTATTGVPAIQPGATPIARRRA